jgi:NurA-like 5'-3' nuclease
MLKKLFESLRIMLLGSSDSRKTEEERVAELNRTIARREVDGMLQKEAAHGSKSREDVGDLVSVIEFRVKANEDEAEDFADGIIPWISIEERDQEIERLLDGDKVVLQTTDAKVIIDYPLDHPTEIILKPTVQGFSRKELLAEIGKRYEEIYVEEEASADTKTLPMNERKILNRNQTDGKYGIWGHDLGDLALSTIEVRRNAAGEIILCLGIES